MSDAITLNDIPDVPPSFCENAPDKDACNQCMGVSEYKCTMDIPEFDLKKGSVLTGANAVKCCALELKKNTLK